MRFLVTAGPTREPIDPVRFLSNRSSGRMGYAIAETLRAQGHAVTLVSGPVSLPVPEGVECIRVETALEMLAACQAVWTECDGLFAVAAVADFRPAEASERKLKRSAGEGRVLELVANPDVLAALAAVKGKRLVVGFALESEPGVEEAHRKMSAKHLDYVCLNGPAAQGAEVSTLVVLGRDGSAVVLGPDLKKRLAEALCARVLLSLDEPG
ncbi:MAG: phosphopantothenoylcysteine decarboxylase [Planctomycetota bacterium]|nr:phosphopantothenoylcysteine decarboxylase [Planctomycetota bacterium]